MKVLVLDIGGTKIASAIIENGTISNAYKVQTPSDKVLEENANVSEKMTACLAQIIAYYDDFDCISVCSTGIIDNGILTALNPKNLGGLNEYPLKETLSKLSQKEVFILNDAQAAAWGEYLCLNNKNIKNFAFITVSTGVGGGIVLNGQLLNSPVAGHIGHSLADPNGEVCGCGRVGCVEAIASGRAIEKKSFDCGLNKKPVEVFELFRAGHPIAEKIINASAKAIANLAADLKIGFDIEQIALGGSVGLADGFIERVQYFLEQMPHIYHIRIEKAQSGANSGLEGAYHYALKHFN